MAPRTASEVHLVSGKGLAGWRDLRHILTCPEVQTVECLTPALQPHCLRSLRRCLLQGVTVPKWDKPCLAKEPSLEVSENSTVRGLEFWPTYLQ